MRALRIAHISTVHSALDARIFYREARSLQDLGCEVTVFGVHPHHASVLGIPIRAMRSLPRARRLATSWYRGLRVVRSHPADVYHFHDPELLPAAVLAHVLLRRRVVFDAHEDIGLVMVKHWLPRWLKRPVTFVFGLADTVLARRVDGVVVPTRLLAEKYRRLSAHVVTFMNYPAPDFLDERDAAWQPYRDRRKEIVHVGTLSKRRLVDLVAIAREFLEAHQDWSWALIGMHQYALGWFDEIVRGPVRERLVAVGKVSQAEVARRLCGVRIGVNYHPLGSRHLDVAIPTKVFEYLACGLPVVTTRVPLLVEAVRHCAAVILTDEATESYLAAVTRLAGRVDSDAMSGAARRFSEEHFDCRTEARKLSGLYAEICRAKGASA